MTAVCKSFREAFAETMRGLQGDVYTNARRHGFHTADSNMLFVPTALALIHSEVSEAMEAHRTGDFEEFPKELADIMIRVMDLAEALHIDLATAIIEKHEFNKSRPTKHGGKLY